MDETGWCFANSSQQKHHSKALLSATVTMEQKKDLYGFEQGVATGGIKLCQIGILTPPVAGVVQDSTSQISSFMWKTATAEIHVASM